LLFVLQYFSAGAILGFLLGTWRRAQALALVGLVVAALAATYGLPQSATGIPAIRELGRLVYAVYVAIAYLSFLVGLTLGVLARELYKSVSSLIPKRKEGDRGQAS